MENKTACFLRDQFFDGTQYLCGQVIQAEAGLIKKLIDIGAVDDSSGAVEFRISCGERKLKHGTETELEPEENSERKILGRKK